MQQISDYELELMKVIWNNDGSALYAEIVSALSVKGMNLDEEYDHHPALTPDR